MINKWNTDSTNDYNNLYLDILDLQATCDHANKLHIAKSFHIQIYFIFIEIKDEQKKQNTKLNVVAGFPKVIARCMSMTHTRAREWEGERANECDCNHHCYFIIEMIISYQRNKY